jgi:hypothetical protein
MSSSCVFAEKECPICRSLWDTTYAGDDTTADLCARRVWHHDSNLSPGDAIAIERLYFADGSIKETTFDYDEDAMRLLLDYTHDEPNSWPGFRELADIWPAKKVKVRILSADEVKAEAEKVSDLIQRMRGPMTALRGLIGPRHEPWEQVAAALEEASGFSIALSKTS